MQPELRKFPYPYRAMLAICSDLDETPDLETYLTLSRYLNTRDDTAIGRGLGLEVGNTLYFDMAPGAFSYWNTTEGGRDSLNALMLTGHIDCFHSFGDCTTTREQVERTYEALARVGCALSVWVDHAVATTNFGPDIMQGSGDVPGSDAYHSDLTIAQGVRYVWLGRVSSCIGQDVPYSVSTGLSQSVDFRAIGNALRDGAKYCLGSAGVTKYALHDGNRLTRKYQLRDGQWVTEFMRCNPHPHGVSVGDDAQGFGYALSKRIIQRLVDREGWCILYTHIGKRVGNPELLPRQTRDSLEFLAERYQQGDILVTSTKRLLDYHQMRQQLTVRCARDAVTIDTGGIDPSGLTLYDLPPGIPVFFEGRHLQMIENPADHSGRPSCSVPFSRLTYPL